MRRQADLSSLEWLERFEADRERARGVAVP
jgi:LPS sulfotransferase NodH